MSRQQSFWSVPRWPGSDPTDHFVAGVLALIVLAIGAARLTDAAGVYHDDAVYLATAKSLAEGTGYRLIDLPGAPAQTKYPFLYPVALSLLWQVSPAFPGNLHLLQAFSLLCAAASIAGAYLFLVRFDYGTRLAAGSSALIAATAVQTSYFATQTLSEFPFALLTLFALWSTERLVQRPTTVRGDAFVGVAAALPFLTRTLGAPGIIAALWHAHSCGRLSRSMVAGACLTAGTWIAWVALMGGSTHAVATASSYYSVQNYLGWWLEASWRVPLVNLLWVTFGSAELASEPISHWSAWPLPVLIGLITWIGIAGRRGRLLPRMLLLYVAVIVFWPWPPRRFLIPFLSFIVFFASQALGTLCHLRSTRRNFAAAATLALLVAGGNLYRQFQVAAVERQTGYPYTGTGEPELVLWENYEKLFAWIRSNTKSSDVLGSGLDSMLYMYTGRQGVRPFETHPAALFYGDPRRPLGNLNEFLLQLRSHDVSYLVELPMPGFSEMLPLADLVKATRETFPRCLREVHRLDADPRFVVFKTDLQMCGH